MQNGGQQKNKKCDVGNYGWEGSRDDVEDPIRSG